MVTNITANTFKSNTECLISNNAGWRKWWRMWWWRSVGSSVTHIWHTTLIVNPEISLRFTDGLPV